jgi:hypothetical protein
MLSEAIRPAAIPDFAKRIGVNAIADESGIRT